MASPVVVERTSRLAAPTGPVWRHATSMDGVNAELGPWVRMTHPAWATDISAAPELLGRVAFRSWLLAGGVVPFDRHALRLVAVEDRGLRGGAFEEDSTSWLQRRWRHDRVVEPAGTGTRVTDTVRIEPRVGFARPVTAVVVGFLFTHRHRRLVARFGAATGPVPSAPDQPAGPAHEGDHR